MRFLSGAPTAAHAPKHLLLGIAFQPDRPLQTTEKTSYSGIEELVAIERSMPRYNAFIAKAFVRGLRPGTMPVDFGAGIGTLSDLFQSHTGVKPICVEVDPTCKDVLSSKGYETCDTISEAGKFNYVFSSNVLEHIENDQDVLSKICDEIDDKGQIVLYLPAFQLLFSELDSSVGHYRRYDKKSLVNKLTDAGFEIEEVSYADCLGFFISLFFRFFGYRSSNGLASPKKLQTYDRFIFPASNVLDRLGMKYVFGKNIYVRARKA